MQREEITRITNSPAVNADVLKAAIDKVLSEGPWRNTFKPLSYAEGACGLLCQLIDIYENSQDAALREYIVSRYDRLMELTAQTNTNNVSLGYGAFGLIFLQTRLFEATNNHNYLKNCQQQLSQILQKRLISLNNEHSLYKGLAGLLFVTLRLLKLTPGQKTYQELSATLIERLTESIKPNEAGTYLYSPRNNTQGSRGLAQGNCGIALVFIQLGRNVIPDSLYEVARHLLLHESAQWETRKHNALSNNEMLQYLEFARVCSLYNTASETESFGKAINSCITDINTRLSRLPKNANSNAPDEPLRAIPILTASLVSTQSAAKNSEDQPPTGTPEYSAAALIDHVLQNDETIPDFSADFSLFDYHRALFNKLFPLSLEVMEKIHSDALKELLPATLDNPIQAFEKCIHNLLSQKNHAELKWKYNFEKQKGDWLASLDHNTPDQENENCSIIHKLLQSKDVYKVPLQLREDNFLLSLEEPVDVFSIDPTDRRALSRVFMTYGARSWLMRKYKYQKPLEIELFFCRILADQYYKPCTLEEGIDRTVEFLLSLDPRTIKLLKSISSYNGEQEFEAHLREIYHDFMYELLFEGFLSPATDT